MSKKVEIIAVNEPIPGCVYFKAPADVVADLRKRYPAEDILSVVETGTRFEGSTVWSCGSKLPVKVRCAELETYNLAECKTGMTWAELDALEDQLYSLVTGQILKAELLTFAVTLGDPKDDALAAAHFGQGLCTASKLVRDTIAKAKAGVK